MLDELHRNSGGHGCMVYAYYKLQIYMQSDWLIFNCSANMSNESWDYLQKYPLRLRQTSNENGVVSQCQLYYTH